MYLSRSSSILFPLPELVEYSFPPHVVVMVIVRSGVSDWLRGGIGDGPELWLGVVKYIIISWCLQVPYMMYDMMLWHIGLSLLGTMKNIIGCYDTYNSPAPSTEFTHVQVGIVQYMLAYAKNIRWVLYRESPRLPAPCDSLMIMWACATTDIHVWELYFQKPPGVC